MKVFDFPAIVSGDSPPQQFFGFPLFFLREMVYNGFIDYLTRMAAMRILYDSKQSQFKTPFGTLTPGQTCTLNIHIPASVLTTKVTCIFNNEDGSWAQSVEMEYRMKKGAYDIFQGRFSIPYPGLFFYYFYIFFFFKSF